MVVVAPRGSIEGSGDRRPSGSIGSIAAALAKAQADLTNPEKSLIATIRALGRKLSDEHTVPVCRLHHRELHRYGDEASWWAGTSVDLLPIALELWTRSRSSHG
jgi:hypothetical protein